MKRMLSIVLVLLMVMMSMGTAFAETAVVDLTKEQAIEALKDARELVVIAERDRTVLTRNLAREKVAELNKFVTAEFLTRAQVRELNYRLDLIRTDEEIDDEHIAEAKKLVTRAAITREWQDIDKARAAVNRIENEIVRLELDMELLMIERDLETIEEELNYNTAKRLVEWAEKSFARTDYEAALRAVNRLQETHRKYILTKRLDKVEEIIIKNEKPVELTLAEKKAALNDKNIYLSDWAVDTSYKALQVGVLDNTVAERNVDLSTAISRVEFVEIIMNYVHLEVPAARIEALKKVNAPIRFADTGNLAVTEATQLGIIAGMDKNIFAPDNTLTREQMAAILDRVNKLINADLVDESLVVLYRFDDVDKIGDWAKQSVANLVGQGAIDGVGNRKFNPTGISTKQEAIRILMDM